MLPDNMFFVATKGNQAGKNKKIPMESLKSKNLP